MRDRPNAADLLDIAYEVLQQKLLPALPPALRYDGLMVANALANAQREIAAAEGLDRAALARLAPLYGEPGRATDAMTLDQALDRLARRLVADIRAGRFDDDRIVADHLLAMMVERVRETAPKYLVGRDLS